MYADRRDFLAILPSHATRASRSLRARLAFASVPLKYAKNITPVLPAINSPGLLLLLLLVIFIFIIIIAGYFRPRLKYDRGVLPVIDYSMRPSP